MTLPIVGITRIRNESDIVADTIHHMETFCDGLIVYDDCSTDNTVQIVRDSSTKLIQLIEGEEWRADRLGEETRHRDLLYRAARNAGAEWVWCFDADERYEGPIRDVLLEGRYDGVRVGLFDAYLTREHQSPYVSGPLEQLPRMFGPEERRILMAWRVSGRFWFAGRDKREPTYAPWARIGGDVPLYAKHYGKALSVEHWQETCRYYVEHFPEPYRSKWAARVGQAIHTTSDFGRLLATWPDATGQAVRIAPPPTSAGRALLSSVKRAAGALAHQVRRQLVAAA